MADDSGSKAKEGSTVKIFERHSRCNTPDCYYEQDLATWTRRLVSGPAKHEIPHAELWRNDAEDVLAVTGINAPCHGETGCRIHTYVMRES